MTVEFENARFAKLSGGFDEKLTEDNAFEIENVVKIMPMWVEV